MTDRVEENAYKWPRRCVFIATFVAIAALIALPFLL